MTASSKERVPDDVQPAKGVVWRRLEDLVSSMNSSPRSANWTYKLSSAQQDYVS